MKVLIVEDHALFREVVARACSDRGHEVVAAVSSVGEAEAACAGEVIDLLVLDLRLTGAPGGTLIDRLQLAVHKPKVLVISAYLTEYVLYRLEQLPVAIGWLGKDHALAEDMIVALDHLQASRDYLAPAYIALRERMRRDAACFAKVLTEYQQLLMRHFALGATDERIASQFGVTVRTVEGHRSRVMKKLGLSNSVQLTLYGRTRGFDLFPAVTQPVREEQPAVLAVPDCGSAPAPRLPRA